MNASSQAMNSEPVSTMGATEQISGLEKGLLVVPLLGAIVFGILPFFFSAVFAGLFGFSGNDVYLYRLAGAVTFGYVPGLVLTILSGQWTPARLIIIATLVFNIGSLYAIGVAILTNTAQPIAYAILFTSLFIIGLTSWMLYRHRDAARPAADTARWLFWLVWLIVFLTVAAFGTGTLFAFVPTQASQLFGFAGTDDFVFRQGGAATLGFAVMGIFELRSRAWSEIRLPSMNALVFNGLSLVATVLAILAGDPIVLLLVVLLVTVVATIGSALALQRQGK
jgi:hypothetical protein